MTTILKSFGISVAEALRAKVPTVIDKNLVKVTNKSKLTLRAASGGGYAISIMEQK